MPEITLTIPDDLWACWLDLYGPTEADVVLRVIGPRLSLFEYATYPGTEYDRWLREKKGAAESVAALAALPDKPKPVAVTIEEPKPAEV